MNLQCVLYRMLTKLAYRDKYLRENPNDFLEKIESMEKSEYAVTANDLKNKSDIPILLFLSCTGYQ